MKENCYANGHYNLNNNDIVEGKGIDNKNGIFQWYFTERGKKTILETFLTEKDVVEFAFQEIKYNETARSHLIVFTDNKPALAKLITALNKRNIHYQTYKIPYSKNCTITRVLCLVAMLKKYPI